MGNYQLARSQVGGPWHVSAPGLDTALCGKPLSYSGPRSPLDRIGEGRTCKVCARWLRKAIDTEVEHLVKIRQEIR